MKYAFEGTAKKGGRERKFRVEVEAKSKGDAEHILYARMGSRLGLKRSQIAVRKVEEVKK